MSRRKVAILKKPKFLEDFFEWRWDLKRKALDTLASPEPLPYWKRIYCHVVFGDIAYLIWFASLLAGWLIEV